MPTGEYDRRTAELITRSRVLQEAVAELSADIRRAVDRLQDIVEANAQMIIDEPEVFSAPERESSSGTPRPRG